jgi:hypothetical protein
MTPLVYPGDKKPCQNITQCPECDGAISEKDAVPFCHNCDKIVDGKKSTPYHGCVPDKGERDKAFGPRTDEITINKGTPLQQGTPNILFPQKANPFNQRQKAAESQDYKKRNKVDPFLAEDDPDTAKKVYVEEVKMCRDPKRENGKFDDKEDVMRSCEDLAIDG